MRKTIVAMAALAGASLALSAASAGTLIPVTPVEGSVKMLVVGINDRNTVTGGYQTSDENFHGFLGTIDGQYTIFDYPAGGTEGRAINDDGYVIAIGNATGKNIYGDAFARKANGDLVPLTKHNKILDGLAQGLRSTNSNFVAERWTLDKDENTFVYGYYGKETKYRSDLTLPLSTDRTRPRGINKAGTVVGYYHDNANHNYGAFVLNGNTVTASHFPDARAYFTILGGINDNGAISGYWSDQNATVGQPFLYHPDSDSYDVIEVPGATFSQGFGINKKGLIPIWSDVGVYIYCPAKPSKCPTGAGAIAIKERRIVAQRGNAIMLSCAEKCVSPKRPNRSLSQLEVAKLREAMKDDPALKLEFGRR